MSSFTSSRLDERHRAVRRALDAAGLDVLIISSLPNIFYLTGFTGTAGVLILTGRDAPLLTDSRYAAFVRNLLTGDGAWPSGALVLVEGSYDETLASWVERGPSRRVGFEAAHLTVTRYHWLRARLGLGSHSGREERSAPALDLVPTEGIVEGFRIRKDAGEIATLRKGGALLSQVAREMLETLHPGSTERQVAALIDDKLRAVGFEKSAFDTIVASGANTALPHARPGGRRLEPGDLVLLDFGGVYDGYCVDLTRTICLGRPDAEMRRLYEAVSHAQRAALSSVKPGVPAPAVDGAARSLLVDRGLGEAFSHGTGHGLGIEVHEAPRVAPARPGTGVAGGEPTIVQEGMVFTVEPGAYLPGWGGVRLEDDVLVTADGCELLTDVPRELSRDGAGR